MNYPKNWNFVNKENRVLFFKKCVTSSNDMIDIFVKSDGAFIFEKSKERGCYVDILNVSQNVRKDLLLHKIAWFQPKNHQICFSDLAYDLLNSESFVDIIKIFSFLENIKHKKRTA